MSDFNPPINSRSTDELIIIAHSDTDEWQQTAIDQARKELQKRNLSEEEQLLKVKEFQDLAEWEFESRADEDYSTISKIFMVLFFWKYLFSQWGLRQNGYHLKFKRRLQLIGLGILFWTLLFVALSQLGSKDYNKRVQEIEEVDISDWEERRSGD